MKYIKYYLSCLLCLLIVSASHAIDPVKRWGQLQVKGNQLCSELK